MTAYNTDTIPDNLYRPGLQDRNEAVISAHFMHSQNLRDEWKLYSGEEYKEKSLSIGAEDLSEILGKFPAQVDDVVENRLTRAIASVQRNWRDFDLKAPNKFGAAEVITEIILDRGFRKGPIENVNKQYLHSIIQNTINRNEPIELIVPLLPNKVDTPLKTRGADPCFAEINLLYRLGEIAGAVDAAYKKFAPDNAPEKSAVFTILADGHRFQSALNIGEDKVDRYQSAIKWWIGHLGLIGTVHFHDYEAVLKQNLDAGVYADRERLVQEARNIYQDAMSDIFDANDIEKSMHKAIQLDPFPDDENAEARFVPLFKSILYTYESDSFYKICKTQGYDAETLYREVTRHVFQKFDHVTDESIDAVRDGFQSNKKIELDNSVREFFRQELLERAWKATIEYLAVVKGDRDLFNDPVAHIYPEHIRYTIHSKKGQIGLNTTGARGGELVQAWHGVAYIRPRRNGSIQIDNASRLMAEGENYTPVVINPDDAEFAPVLSNMGQTGQALFYVHKDLPVSNVGELKNLMAEKLTRLVFDR